MIAELGHFLAFLALASAAAQGAIGLTEGGVAVKRLAMATGGFVVASFACLIISFVTLDFSVALVASHSHSLKPILYRIAGTWGNHEGSMLLWSVIMAGYGAVAALVMRGDALRDKALGVQGVLTAMSMAYLLFASSPFTRLDPAPFDGGGLNPLLQDPALAFHPPFLYLGYVGFSFVFSLAAAGLLIGKIDSEWAARAQPWALAAWSALTVGISLGAIWAYYELGWGGWWFWDPVENASFMPWLVGAALVHSLLVTRKRGGMASWTAFLAVLAFCLSMLGAFLVRSGVLNSVHTFAMDPKRGMLLLGGLAVAGGAAFALYAWRAPSLKAGPEYDPVSREGALVLNNLFLAVSAATVLLGTVLPIVTEAYGMRMSIQEPYFHLTVAPLLAVLFLFIPFALLAPWRKADLKSELRRLAPAGAISLVVAIAAFAFGHSNIWLAFGVFVGSWVACGVAIDLWRRAGSGGPARLLKLSPGVWGMAIAHLGLAIFVVGAATETAARVERTFVLEPGQTAELRGWTFRLVGVGDVEGPNYNASRADILATKGSLAEHLYPEKRLYPVAGTPTTEVAIRKSLTGDIYVALGDPVREQPGAWRMRISHHPMIDWVFGGAGLIALGGVMSLVAHARRRLKRTSSETREATGSAAPAPDVSPDAKGAPA
ncbi:MAG: heme lyase CcmF/NrfE family subunit [Hyphomonadaceae bacterium]